MMFYHAALIMLTRLPLPLFVDYFILFFRYAHFATLRCLIDALFAALIQRR